MCCDQSQFILDYAEMYSISEISIVVNTEEIKEPIVQPYVTYISYGSSSDLKDVSNMIRTMQDETQLLAFIGSDHTELLNLLDNETTIFHSGVKGAILK